MIVNRRRFLLSALAAPVVGAAVVEPLSAVERVLRDSRLFASNPRFLMAQPGSILNMSDSNAVCDWLERTVGFAPINYDLVNDEGLWEIIRHDRSLTAHREAVYYTCRYWADAMPSEGTWHNGLRREVDCVQIEGSVYRATVRDAT